MTARVSMLLKSRASLTCFRACFFPDRAKDLSAPRYYDYTLMIQNNSRRSCQFSNVRSPPSANNSADAVDRPVHLMG